MSPSAPPVIQEPEFRRQFLMGSRIPAFPPRWTRHSVREGLELVAHPDLPLTRVAVPGRELILLGFVLDPLSPERDDREVLVDVLTRTVTFDDVIRAFDAFGGRWAVIHVASDDIHVFHDAAGLRSVYHHTDAEGAVWVGSQPTLLARVLSIPEDEETRERLREDGIFEPGVNHFWPGAGSPFLGVHRLLPNHCLSLASGEASRYWPRGPIRSVDLDEATDRCLTTLRGTVSSAAARYPLALALTAGIDSRLLLAASRDHAAQISCYTFKRSWMNSRTQDLRVPRTMTRDLGIRYRVIPVPHMSDSPAARAIYSTFRPYHQLKADEATAMSVCPPVPAGDWLTVNGNLVEIGRPSASRFGFKQLPATPANFALSIGMADSEVAIQEFASWFDDVRDHLDIAGADPWDLFYWEQKMGGWFATLRAEYDVVEDGVSPFNSRGLIECLWGLDESLRRTPDFTLFHDLIEQMWPELLDYPINRPRIRARLKDRVRSVTARVPGRVGSATG